MNFTVIMSGGCRAKCGFCTDPMNRPASQDYILNLAKFLGNKPNFLKEVSISGGEPTASPHFGPITTMLRAFFPKVVLTTNGEKLQQPDVMNYIVRNINHLNLSRHGRNYQEVLEVFKTRSIPDDYIVRGIISNLNKSQIDVNLNHVYTTADTHIDVNYIRDYVKYAKELGASSVTFRFDHSENDLGLTPAEISLISAGYVFKQTACPVCRSMTFLVDGMTVNMKASMLETINDKEGIHEVIYHINGKLTADWAAEKEVEYNSESLYFPEKNIKFQLKKTEPAVEVPRIEPASSSCTAERILSTRSVSNCGVPDIPVQVLEHTTSAGDCTQNVYVEQYSGCGGGGCGGTTRGGSCG